MSPKWIPACAGMTYLRLIFRESVGGNTQPDTRVSSRVPGLNGYLLRDRLPLEQSTRPVSTQPSERTNETMRRIATKAIPGFGVLLALTLAGSPLLAQEVTGSIRGVVFDPSGAGVPAAEVSATQIETGRAWATVVDRHGAYLFVLLPVGRYRLEATAQGFQRFVQEGITLSVNESASVPIHLKIGSSAEVVQVRANAALIETANTTLGQTVGEREILDLPLNGRNFSQLGLLQPGVVPLTPGLAEAGGSLRDGQPYSVNGQRPGVQRLPD